MLEWMNLKRHKSVFQTFLILTLNFENFEIFTISELDLNRNFTKQIQYNTYNNLALPEPVIHPNHCDLPHPVDRCTLFQIKVLGKFRFSNFILFFYYCGSDFVSDLKYSRTSGSGTSGFFTRSGREPRVISEYRDPRYRFRF